MEQVKELTGGKIKKAIVDKGYKVKGGIAGSRHSNAEDAQKRKLLPEKETRRTMQVKSRNRGTDITPETRSQDDKKLPQRHSWRPNQHIIGCCSIQYEEMDEIKTTRNIEFNFSLDFTRDLFWLR